MPSLTRRALVTLAALGPAAALAAPGSAATGSGAPPSSPEAQALLERAAYRGGLDVILRKGAVRVLTAYSKTDFFVDRGETGGVTCEYMRAFEAFLRKRQGGKGAKVVVSFVPVSRDRLVPGLLAGEGDLAAANLTVTPERRARVDFSEPYLEGVREVVVTGPASPDLAAVDDLAGREGWVGGAAEQLRGEPPGRRPAPRRREARAPAAGRGRRAPRGRGPARHAERRPDPAHGGRRPQGPAVDRRAAEDRGPRGRVRAGGGPHRLRAAQAEPEAQGRARRLRGEEREGDDLRQHRLHALLDRHRGREGRLGRGGAAQVREGARG